MKLFNIYCVAVVTVIACMSTLYAAEAPRFSRDPREVLRTDHYQEIKRLACDHGQRVKKIDDIALASGCAAGCCCCACGALSCCICSHVAPYFIPPIFAQMVPPVAHLGINVARFLGLIRCAHCASFLGCGATAGYITRNIVKHSLEIQRCKNLKAPLAKEMRPLTAGECEAVIEGLAAARVKGTRAFYDDSYAADAPDRFIDDPWVRECYDGLRKRR